MSELVFSSGVVAIPTFTSTLGAAVAKGQRVKVVDSGNIYVLYRSALGTESFNDIKEKVMTQASEEPLGTTQTDVLIDAKDEWETVDGVLTPKTGEAPNGVGLATSTTTYTYTGQTDFGSAGANISYAANNWSNDLVASGTTFNTTKNTDATTPYAVSESSSQLGLLGWKTLNGVTTDTWASANATPTTEQWITYDFGSAVTLVSARIFGYTVATGPNPKTYKIQGSTDNFVADTNDLLSVVNTKLTAAWTSLQAFTASGSYRYYRFLSIASDDNAAGIGEIDFRESVPATTSNDVEVITGLSSGTFHGIFNFSKWNFKGFS